MSPRFLALPAFVSSVYFGRKIEFESVAGEATLEETTDDTKADGHSDFKPNR